MFAKSQIENFKSIFSTNHWADKLQLFKIWIDDALNKNLKYVNQIVETFKRYIQGIENALITGTTSAKHENLNGKIQSVLAKARGFLNFDRFKINVMFYFGNLNLNPLKFTKTINYLFFWYILP